MHVNDLLKIAVDNAASGLHLKVGAYPMMRVRGDLIPATDEKRFDHEDVVTMSAAVMSVAQRQKFKEAQEVDLAYSVPGLGRFRCNIFQQRGTVGLILRVIPMQIQTVERLGLPAALTKIAAEDRGPGPRDGHDRLRQDHDARRDDRPHQREPLHARDDRGGSHRVSPPRPAVAHQPARGLR